MSKIAIVYGSSTDNTKQVAGSISQRLSGNDVKVFDVARLNPDDLKDFPNLVLGTSTLGLGDIQDDWYYFLPKMKNIDLNGKIVALFGLGDSAGFSDTFVDGMGILYEEIKGRGCKVVGATDANSYTFDDSVSVVDGKFVGLPIDEDNESDRTNSRLDAWIKVISPEFI